MPTPPADLDDIVRRALAEDLGPAGDVTTAAVIDEDAGCEGRVVTRAPGVVAGLPVFEACMRALDPAVEVRRLAPEGASVEAEDELAWVGGPAHPVLAAERVALNLLAHLCGVATLTRVYVEACAGTRSVILCTRKTLPGLRAAQRYAVEAAGARLHRFGLSDGVLIKDNHVALAGGVAEAVRRARTSASHTLRVEVEVETLEQLEEAVGAGADAVLLDNADLDNVKRAVDLVSGRIPLEVSGGITVEQVREIAPLGELLISVGRITHSAPALDLSLELTPPTRR